MINVDGFAVPIHMAVKLVTGPSEPLVTVDDFKRSARYDGDYLNGQIEAWLTAARVAWEYRTNHITVSSTYDIAFDKVPGERWIKLPLSPLISVSSVTSYDVDGAATVMSASDYGVDTYSAPSPRVYLAKGASWPTGLRPVAALVVRGVFGYASVDDARLEPAKQFVRLLATHYLEQPSATNEATGQPVALIPEGLAALMGPQMQVSL